MYFRTYFEKDNTILKDSLYNFGASPVIDLFYGGTRQNPIYSRYIFKFDESRLKTMYDNCELGDLSQVKHKLKFKNCGYKNDEISCMATNFDLCLFPLNQDWDEGCGSDTNCAGLCSNIAKINCNVSLSVSNWKYATSDTEWNQFGIFSGTTEYISCQSINCDSYDIEFDVTDIVNDLITGTTINYGYGLAFDHNLELSGSTIQQHLNLFGKETRTFFEPYLETEYINWIKDDRTNFYLDKDNRLYFFVEVDGQPTALDNLPIVKIYNPQNILQATITAKCQGLGIYYVDYLISSGTIDKCMAWVDEWTNVSLFGLSKPNVKMKFLLKPADEYFSFGSGFSRPEEYAFGFRGIKRDEKIVRGDVRKINIDVKSPSNPTKQKAVDGIFYRVYLKDGQYDELDIIKWHPLNSGICENWFLLDTSWMIPQVYYLDFKIVKSQTIKTYSKELKFIVIEKDQIR